MFLAAEPEPTLSWRDVAAGVSSRVVTRLLKDRLLGRDEVRMVIPDRTLERRIARGENLRLEEVDGIARLLRVRRQAAEALGEAAEIWLTEPNPALGGEIPIRMARTDIGAREVEAVLGRLAHGVFG
jgi:putative toxin-antitoxin system antitoxin component (TIGR02293 family)